MTAPAFLTSFRFAVEITPSGFGGDEGLGAPTRGAFSEVSGLERTVDMAELREGGYNHGVRQLVGRTSHAPLVLKRGMTLDSAFWTWIERCVVGDYPLPYVDGTILVFPADTATDDTAAARFVFRSGIVTKVVAPTLSASSASAVPIEELHIAHEGLERVAS